MTLLSPSLHATNLFPGRLILRDNSIGLERTQLGARYFIIRFWNFHGHTIFSTDRIPPAINNKTFSCFNLSSLYGGSQWEEDKVCDKDFGRGILHPDCFADSRMLLLLPTAATLLVFNRSHNAEYKNVAKKFDIVVHHSKKNE